MMVDGTSQFLLSGSYGPTQSSGAIASSTMLVLRESMLSPLRTTRITS